MASEIFNKCMQFIIPAEGGYVNNPSDPGGETNYGISKRQYPNVDIKNLSLADALAIYEKDYWDPSWEKLGFPLAMCMMDTSVNMGRGVAEKCLMASDNNYVEFLQRRIARYNAIVQNPSMRVFWQGWMNRVRDLRRYIEAEK